ncbi:MAG: hypothetical protein ACJAWV_004336 [Flammeovirgaceae bacterium]|jgi:hypothetical protein
MRFLSTKVHQRYDRAGWEVYFQSEDWNENRHKSAMLTLAPDGATAVWLFGPNIIVEYLFQHHITFWTMRMGK